MTVSGHGRASVSINLQSNAILNTKNVNGSKVTICILQESKQFNIFVAVVPV